MKQKPVIEALEAANNALQGELENREKLKEELQASEPEIREAIQASEKARSLAQEVQEKQVNEKVWKSRSGKPRRRCRKHKRCSSRSSKSAKSWSAHWKNPDTQSWMESRSPKRRENGFDSKRLSL